MYSIGVYKKLTSSKMRTHISLTYSNLMYFTVGYTNSQECFGLISHDFIMIIGFFSPSSNIWQKWYICSRWNLYIHKKYIHIDSFWNFLTLNSANSPKDSLLGAYCATIKKSVTLKSKTAIQLKLCHITSNHG